MIVPFYEMQDYVDEAIASVEASRGPTWEIVLVDDGSRSEGARKWLDAAAARRAGDSRFRVLREPPGDGREKALAVVVNLPAEGHGLTGLDAQVFIDACA